MIIHYCYQNHSLLHYLNSSLILLLFPALHFLFISELKSPKIVICLISFSHLILFFWSSPSLIDKIWCEFLIRCSVILVVFMRTISASCCDRKILSLNITVVFWHCFLFQLILASDSFLWTLMLRDHLKIYFWLLLYLYFYHNIFSDIVLYIFWHWIPSYRWVEIEALTMLWFISYLFCKSLNIRLLLSSSGDRSSYFCCILEWILSYGLLVIQQVLTLLGFISQVQFIFLLS